MSRALPAAVYRSDDPRADSRVARVVPAGADIHQLGNCVLGYSKSPTYAGGTTGARQPHTLTEMKGRGYRNALRSLVQYRRENGVVIEDLTAWATIAADIAAAIFGPGMTLRNAEGQCVFIGVEVDRKTLAPIAARAAQWRRAPDYQPLSGDDVGRLVRLCWQEREELGIKCIGSSDETADERRLRLNRRRKRLARERAGARPRTAPKPWDELGIKRSSYYARGLHLDSYGHFSVTGGKAPETVQNSGKAPVSVQDSRLKMQDGQTSRGKAPETVQRGGKMTQLDLFSELPEKPSVTPPTATLLPFPLARRRKLIVRTAGTLAARKTLEGREGYWARTLGALARELRRHGAPDAEVHAQLNQFHTAVGDELARGDQQHRQPPGTA